MNKLLVLLNLCGLVALSAAPVPPHPPIPGLIELPGFIGTNRLVTFAATGGGTTQAWTANLTFTNSVAPFTLTNLPLTTTHISVKTDWHTRKKLSIALPPFFIGTNAPRSGDFNGDNIINFPDFNILAGAWYGFGSTAADLTGDGLTTFPDYALFAPNYFTKGDDP